MARKISKIHPPQLRKWRESVSKNSATTVKKMAGKVSKIEPNLTS
jgi:hypothetical protein